MAHVELSNFDLLDIVDALDSYNQEQRNFFGSRIEEYPASKEAVARRDVLLERLKAAFDSEPK
jgi:hypothetical protein